MTDQNKHTILLPIGLYIVSTPIGNLSDISERACRILASVELIAAEDTRHSRVLLDTYGIRTPMQAYHEHNARRVLPRLIEDLKSKKSIALISDAGTPALSDPGYRLIHETIAEGIAVFSIPGPSAILSALVVSGLPTDRFTFEGFLPRKKGRQTRLSELAREPRTMIFFESPLRIAKTIEELTRIFGETRCAAVCRELTKHFEEVIRGTLGELNKKFVDTSLKGEITLVVEGGNSYGKRKRHPDTPRCP